MRIISEAAEKSNLLCTLISQKIDPNKFGVNGFAIYWIKEPTDEEKGIALDIIANYEILALAHDSVINKQSAINRVQTFMDAKAQEYGYDHILSASTYSTSTFSKFQAEGIAFAKWRDDVWLHCYSVLAEWEAGTSVITTEDELIASLPEFTVTY